MDPSFCQWIYEYREWLEGRLRFALSYTHPNFEAYTLQ